jgi:hypothetical protein
LHDFRVLPAVCTFSVSIELGLFFMLLVLIGSYLLTVEKEALSSGENSIGLLLP